MTEVWTPLLKERERSKQYGRENWTIEEVERYMNLLLRQTHVDLEIFLMLDALDEYDGQPEFISKILKEMMTSTIDSRTKLKVLFSSRPWEYFMQQFQNWPSIQLQNYTKGDIENYCWSFVYSKGGAVSTTLELVVQDVINRADGVFLWVKLVLNELANEAPRENDPDKLVSTLDLIPSDLHNYYTKIIQGIPENFRWYSYVIFEGISKQSSFPTLDSVIHALECSRYSTLRECCEAGDELRPKMRQQSYIEAMQGKILARMGNLIEFHSIIDGMLRAVDVQFAHQTIRDFVQGQSFKQLILGRRATRTRENGYTFLAKYCLVNSCLSKGSIGEAASYLRGHEITTGYSLKYFIDSVLDQDFKNKYAFEMYGGPLSIAMIGNLQIYMKETLQSNPGVFRKTREKLLSMKPFPFPYLLHEEVYSDVNRTQQILLSLILENGYTTHKDPLAFEEIMMDIEIAGPGSYDRIRYPSGKVDFTEAKAMKLVQYGQDPNTPIAFSMPPSNVWKRTRGQHVSERVLGPLHIAKTAEFVRCLLEHGARVNEPDTFGSTPLDHVFSSIRLTSLTPDSKRIWVSLLYETAKILIEHGGTTNTSTWKHWESVLFKLRVDGHDVKQFLECRDKIRFEEDVNDKRRGVKGKLSILLMRN
ncbi:uncharacterized protein F4822DRAFT_424924 [Hypoxylon trugodes]|uniref:uncharacterized protein n=1 Tax=Hypoxylon trugodes TaxID=326681 RepID=UPI00219E8426|nr:uncharacterized protein F4822DRAFT_424924 [Hypoxylon trugodes]KAI1394447.1 hypothetical protein F4822DRAFT_424924 [Hypoxylon trugodes]